MYPNRELTLGFEWEPADEALEELLSRVSDESHPYHGNHGHHGVVDGFDDAVPVAVGSDDDQA